MVGYIYLLSCWQLLLPLLQLTHISIYTCFHICLDIRYVVLWVPMPFFP